MVSKLARIWVKENSMPLGTEKNTLLGAAGGVTGNWFGDGSDGAFTSDGSDTQTVLNKSGSYDGDMLVRNYTTFTIGSGHTYTVDQPCRGMLIYVSGNASITGTVSMTSKGGFSNPTTSGGSDSAVVNASGLQLGMFTASGTSTLAAATFAGSGNAAVSAVANQPAIAGDGSLFKISKAGSAGGASVTCAPSAGHSVCTGIAGSSGSSGVTCTTGGGGGGGAGTSPTKSSSPCGVSGAGGTGGSFSGGSGGGAGQGVDNNTCRTGTAGANYGGAGGIGAYGGNGAGNPGNAAGCGTTPGGVGGIIWLIVGGDLTISGSIQANGGAGGSACSTWGGDGASAGGGGGAGAVMVLYAGTLSNSGTITATAGAGGSSNQSSPNGGSGGAGGAGGVHTAQVIA